MANQNAARAAEGMTPTGKLLLAGAVAFAGVWLFTRRPAAAATTPTTTVLPRSVAPTAAPAPVPSQAGITFRSGSLGGFIPIPFDQIISGIASIFQPSRIEAQVLASPQPVSPPPAEQQYTLAEISNEAVGDYVWSDGQVTVPEDQWASAGYFYE